MSRPSKHLETGSVPVMKSYVEMTIAAYFLSSYHNIYRCVAPTYYTSDNVTVVPPDCDLHMLSASPVEQKEHKEEEEKTHPDKSVSGLQYLPVSPSAFLVLVTKISGLTFTSDAD